MDTPDEGVKLCKKCGSEIHFENQLNPSLCYKCALEELDEKVSDGDKTRRA